MAGEVKQSNWVDGAAMDGERWVDPMDAAAVDAWGTAPVAAPAAAFDPTMAFQEKPQRCTSLQGSEALGGKEGRRSGSLQPIQDRGELIQKGELIQQGTHQQTHPRQRQNWSPSPASLSPAVVKAADGGSSASLTSASDESLGEASDAQQQLPATTGGCAMPQQTATFPGPSTSSHAAALTNGAIGAAQYPVSHAIAPTNGVSLDEGGSSGGDFFDSGSDDDDLAGDSDEDIPEDVAKALGRDNLIALKEMGSGPRDIAATRLPADCGDASMNGGGDLRGDSEPEGASSDDDLDADYDPTYAFGPKCINCTAPLHIDLPCSECGHDPVDDDLIFNTEPQASPLQSKHHLGSWTTLLAYDERMTLHEEDSDSPHPERPVRIRAVIARLMATGLADRCHQVQCREATVEEIEACHRPELVSAVAALSSAAAGSNGEPGSPAYFTQDTYVNSSTYTCARLAAGGCIDVATAVARGTVSSGAAIVRPPGHHAESGMAMGFCYFNNAALAARAAQAAGAQKVLVLDWDVHHGNGTQHIFERDPSVLYMSIHRYDGGHFYPGTGAVQEVGKGPGEGFTVNVPWPMGAMGNGDYMAAFSHIIVPIAHEYRPDLVIISAGFDASAGDPIGGCRLTPEAYAHMTAMLGAVAPLAVLLEGGYNLRATAAGCEATLRVLLGQRVPHFAKPTVPSTPALLALQQVVRMQAKYWRCLRGLSEQAVFNPYSTPYAIASAGTVRRPSLDADQLSPRHLAKKQRPAHETTGAAAAAAAPGSERCHGAAPETPRIRGGTEGGDSVRPTTPRAGPTSPRSVAAGSPEGFAKALHRTKYIAKKGGKSQRRWQMMHALHLVALREMIKKHHRKRMRQQPPGQPGHGQVLPGTPYNSLQHSP